MEEKIMELLNLSKEESLNLLDLRKNNLSLLCLEKKPLQNLTSRVGVVMDISGSMRELYKNGTVQAVLERLFPIALQFDNNGEMEFWIFSDNFYRLPNITMDNYYGYINKNVINKYDMGGTNYAPPLKDIYKKYMLEEPAALPNYIIFITDGDNWDKRETNEVMKKISNYPIFIQYMGLKNRYSTFEYLEQLDKMDGRYVDNANFFDVSEINNIEDSVLYEKLLAEYPSWLEYPQVQKMIQSCSSENPDIFDNKDKRGKKGFFAGLFS